MEQGTLKTETAWPDLATFGRFWPSLAAGSGVLGNSREVLAYGQRAWSVELGALERRSSTAGGRVAWVHRAKLYLFFTFSLPDFGFSGSWVAPGSIHSAETRQK